MRRLHAALQQLVDRKSGKRRSDSAAAAPREPRKPYGRTPCRFVKSQNTEAVAQGAPFFSIKQIPSGSYPDIPP